MRTWCAFLAVLLAAFLPGCAEITVRKSNAIDLVRDWEANLLSPGQLSPRSVQTLRRFDLERVYVTAPEEAFTRLEAITTATSEPDAVFTLAEMAYLFGVRNEARNSGRAAMWFHHSAGYAYHYIFPEATPMTCDYETVYDPRFRLACDLYNAGLAKCIRAAQRAGQLDPGQRLRLPTPDGQGYELNVVQHRFTWRPDEFGPLLFCSDYQVVGLDNQYRGYGLGVPLMGTRPANAPPGGSLRYPKAVCFPVTAFFRFEGTLADMRAHRSGTLELYNPLALELVEVAGRKIPLESDLTTPLAYHLSDTDLGEMELLGFLRGDRLGGKEGLYSLEPYQPGKIPVVMVHGLLSSPVTWAPMFNDLRADPTLREHFQFWFYRYPTGQPYIVTAADLRETLAEVREQLDPQHRDPALDRMVFVGHSMGGLVSELMTQDSGDDFWRLVSSQPFDSLKLKPETRVELDRVLFFRQLPCVRRVVFIGTPHHGSKLSPSLPARVLVYFVKLPSRLLSAVQDAMEQNPGFWKGGNGTPTSIDLLAPNSPALELIASRPKPEGVYYHTIIGSAPGGNILRKLSQAFGEKEPSDGLVPIRSAHRDGVDSELIVEADHTHVHQHPLSVLEVRRILLEHLQEQPTTHAAPKGMVNPDGNLAADSDPLRLRRNPRR
jgi:pimeloyl-ACP methyl ester carboxylesterase